MMQTRYSLSSGNTGRLGRVLASILLAMLILMAAACVPRPPMGLARVPDRAVPSSFSAGEDTRNSGLIAWRDFFQDPQLVALIEAALERNQELNLAIQETIVANAEVMSRRGEYLPRVGFGVGGGTERVGQFTSQGRSDEMAGIGPNLPRYEPQLYSSWEIDIWRRLRDLTKSASLRYLASIEARNFMITRLVAEIASSYYELLALDRQLRVLTDNISLQEQALELARAQFEAGRATSAAPARFEANLRAMQSSQYAIQQRIVETENQINFLAGRFPKPIDRSRSDFLDLQPAALAVGVPADLLTNRPDIRQAELELSAAGLEVQAARKAFYPALGIESVLGYQTYDFTKLLSTPDSLLYGFFSRAFAPVLNRKGIEANYYSANSREMQAVLRYERAVLTAFMEVSNRVSLTRTLSDSYRLKQQQVERLGQAVEMSTALFNLNRAEYLEVLTARREWLDAQQDLVELKQRQMAAAVTLYQALGGGWRGAGLNPPDGSSANQSFKAREVRH